MNIRKEIKELFKHIYNAKFGDNLSLDSIIINETRDEFEGDLTIVLFPFVKKSGLPLKELGDFFGKNLKANSEYVEDFNLVKGFLNLKMTNEFWFEQMYDSIHEPLIRPVNERRKILVEYSSPNTNKPLHLGHIRNILLGWSTYKILDAIGHEVVRTQIINDRGIAICKSMLAWKKYMNGNTPESEGIKSDHFVGECYVLFNKKLEEEYKAWQDTEEAFDVYQNDGQGQDKDIFFKKYKNTYFNSHSLLGQECKEMLHLWESGDSGTRNLWSKMNNWCYEGFNTTYDNLGVCFDILYYESDTYLLGKEVIENGLNDCYFYKKEDNSTWVDLSDIGLDHKILMRSDGTSVYMTQDIGTAQQRYEDHHCDQMIYVVGDEQEYHFSALFAILKKIDEPYSNYLYHLSYGMVDLPTGKMKSREGTVVDADQLIEEVIAEAEDSADQKSDLSELSRSEQDDIYRIIGLGALKFFILKIAPKKRMIFDPKESVDMQGQTGPYIQNAYVRIKSVMQKTDFDPSTYDLKVSDDYTVNDLEKKLLSKLSNYELEVYDAALELDPSKIANYCYETAKMYHKFYNFYRILTAETKTARSYRLALSHQTARVLSSGMDLLGIEMPDKM